MLTLVLHALTNSEYSPEIAGDMLRNGEIIAFPTETVYGLGTDIYNEVAVKKLYKLKNRNYSKPLTAHLSDISMIQRVADFIPDEARILAECFLPGPLTIILPKKKEVPAFSTANLNTIGIRVPDNEIFRAIAESFGGIIGATSANISEMDDSTDFLNVQKYFDNLIPLIIDGGSSVLKIPSTVADLSKKPYKILRKGAISKEEIEAKTGILLLE